MESSNKTVHYFWGVLRPDGRLVPQTFSSIKGLTELNAGTLTKKHHKMRWRDAKKKYNYQVVKIEAVILTATGKPKLKWYQKLFQYIESINLAYHALLSERK